MQQFLRYLQLKSLRWKISQLYHSSYVVVYLCYEHSFLALRQTQCNNTTSIVFIYNYNIKRMCEVCVCVCVCPLMSALITSGMV